MAHPHVVVQDNVFNRSRIESAIVCALSSNLKRAAEPGNVLLDAGEGGLPKQSVVVVSQISAVGKAAWVSPSVRCPRRACSESWSACVSCRRLSCAVAEQSAFDRQV